MLITSRRFVRQTIAFLLVGLLALLVIVGTSLWLGERTQTYFNDVLEARDARTAAVDLRNSLQEAETSQRGYLLTGNEAYLDVYGPARDASGPQFENLKRILAPYPQADEAVAHLKQALDQKFAEMESTVTLKRAGNDAEALAIVNSDAGKALMDEARTFFSGLIAAADNRLTTGVSDQRASATALRWVSILGALVIVIVVGGSAITVVRYTRELARARDEVAGLNAGLEERVQERTADLGRANEEIQRFAYIVTHDLRAPLVNIMGFTSELETSLQPIQSFVAKADNEDDDGLLASARTSATGDLPEAIGFIRSSTKKMDGLINAILKLSREGRRALRPEVVDLKALVAASTAALQHQIIEAEGEVVSELSVPPIMSDRMSLEQIFGNLLDNAVKYRARGRPLRVEVRGTLAPGNRVVIEVEDNGRGIATQDLERVFELFRRSGAQDQPGEGIGLAYVRTVVRNLGGDISVASVAGQGTTFSISLPRTILVPQPGSRTT